MRLRLRLVLLLMLPLLLVSGVYSVVRVQQEARARVADEHARAAGHGANDPDRGGERPGPARSAARRAGRAPRRFDARTAGHRSDSPLRPGWPGACRLERESGGTAPDLGRRGARDRNGHRSGGRAAGGRSRLVALRPARPVFRSSGPGPLTPHAGRAGDRLYRPGWRDDRSAGHPRRIAAGRGVDSRAGPVDRRGAAAPGASPIGAVGPFDPRPRRGTPRAAVARHAARRARRIGGGLQPHDGAPRRGAPARGHGGRARAWTSSSSCAGRRPWPWPGSSPRASRTRSARR